MTSLGWSVVTTTALLLEPCEREAVLGDIAESESDVWRGFEDVAGLALRRQLQLWRDWRPWLATFGLALPCSFLFMGFSLSVSGMAREIPHQSGIGQLFSQATLLAICAWTCGYVASTLARQTIWISAAACALPCLFCLSRFGIQHQSRWELLIFLLPAAFGVLVAWRMFRSGRRISQRTALLLALLTTALALPAIHAVSGLIVLVLAWPGWYLAVTSRQQSQTN